MKNTLALVGLLISFDLLSQNFTLVLGPNDLCNISSITATCNPTEPRKLELVNNVRRKIANNITYQDSIYLRIPLITWSWGKQVNNDCSGILLYYKSFSNGFFGNIIVTKLLPNHEYLLTLNGKPNHPGNDLLPDTTAKEGYYDFLRIKTDVNGHSNTKFALFLKTGVYDVKFFIKDLDDYKIVFYHDFLLFTVN
jgi:hypothetical protein